MWSVVNSTYLIECYMTVIDAWLTRTSPKEAWALLILSITLHRSLCASISCLTIKCAHEMTRCELQLEFFQYPYRIGASACL